MTILLIMICTYNHMNLVCNKITTETIPSYTTCAEISNYIERRLNTPDRDDGYYVRSMCFKVTKDKS